MSEFRCTIDLRHPNFEGDNRRDALVAALRDMVSRIENGHEFGGFNLDPQHSYDGGFVVGALLEVDRPPVREIENVVRAIVEIDPLTLSLAEIRKRYDIKYMSDEQLRTEIDRWLAYKKQN